MLNCAIHEPCMIHPDVLLALEDFRFPHNEYTYRERLIELEIDRLYNDRSRFIIFYMDEKIVASIRLINKFKSEDKLPIEYSRDIKTKDNFIIKDSLLPAGEIGGLRVANISDKDRCYVLSQVLKKIVENCLDGSYKNLFLTCDPSMTRLYMERMSFYEVGTVAYGDKKYSALSRSCDFNGTPYKEIPSAPYKISYGQRKN